MIIILILIIIIIIDLRSGDGEVAEVVALGAKSVRLNGAHGGGDDASGGGGLFGGASGGGGLFGGGGDGAALSLELLGEFFDLDERCGSYCLVVRPPHSLCTASSLGELFDLGDVDGGGTIDEGK